MNANGPSHAQACAARNGLAQQSAGVAVLRAPAAGSALIDVPLSPPNPHGYGEAMRREHLLFPWLYTFNEGGWSEKAEGVSTRAARRPRGSEE